MSRVSVSGTPCCGNRHDAVPSNNTYRVERLTRIFHRLVLMGESTAVCGKTLTGSLTGTPQ